MISSKCSRLRIHAGLVAYRGSSPVRAFHHLAEFRELNVISRRQDDVTVGGRERDVVGHDIGVRVTMPRRVLARVEVLYPRDSKAKKSGFRKVTGRYTVAQRCRRGGATRRGCWSMRACRSSRLRSRCRFSSACRRVLGDGHDAPHALRQKIVSCPVAIGGRSGQNE